MSRSFVGSSMTSTLDGCVNSRASSRRLRSPPDSDELANARVPAETGSRRRYVITCARSTADFDEFGAGADAVHHGRIADRAVRATGRSRPPRDWCRGAPCRGRARVSPASACSSVRLARAVGADEADPVAAHDRASSIADQRRSPPSRLLTPRAPRPVVPTARRRQLQAAPRRHARAARRAPPAAPRALSTRPSLRVRRAWMPVRIHTSSCASRLSTSACSRRLVLERRALRSR